MNHSLTEDQKKSIADDVIVEAKVSSWKQIDPTRINETVKEAVWEVESLVEKYKGVFEPNEEVSILVQGHPVATFRLVNKLKTKGYTVVSAHSKRKSIEKTIDGKTVKKSVFKHMGWIEY